MRDGMTLYNDDSWMISYSVETGELIFKTTDYHADPLRVGVDSLVKMIQGAGAGAAEGPGLPADHVALFRRAGYEVGLSKKEKSLCAAPVDGKGQVLKISRKEMSGIGKKMNKRAKGTKKK